MSTIPPRWYMLNNIGMATLCSSENDAKLEAANANEYFPRMAPHRAVQLVDVAEREELLAALSALVGANSLQSLCRQEGRDMLGRVRGTWGADAEDKARFLIEKANPQPGTTPSADSPATTRVAWP